MRIKDKYDPEGPRKGHNRTRALAMHILRRKRKTTTTKNKESVTEVAGCSRGVAGVYQQVTGV